MKEEQQETVAIIISQRDIRIPLKCPECNKWNKTPIKSVKTTCASCKKDFEKNPMDDDINTIECLRDAAWLGLKLFTTQDEVTVQYGEYHKEKAELLFNIFKQAFGIEVGLTKQKTIFADKLKKHIIINETIIYKPEHMVYYNKK